MGGKHQTTFCLGTERSYSELRTRILRMDLRGQVLHNHERETLAGHYETGTCAPRTDTAHPLSVLTGCEMLTWDNVLGRGGG